VMRSELVVEGEDKSDADMFEGHFSTLLFRACLQKDVAAAADFLPSRLSTADANTRCRVRTDTSDAWERLFRGFRPISATPTWSGSSRSTLRTRPSPPTWA